VAATGVILTAWAVDPVPTAGIVLAATGYAAAAARVPAARRRGAIAFAAGLAVLLVAVDGPPDVLAEVSFTAHMTQHLLIQLVAAPLLVLGAPVGLLLRADPPWAPRRYLARLLRTRPARLLAHPLTGVSVFSGVLLLTHLTPLYDLALRSPAVHGAEHAAYLVAALLLWTPLIGTDPLPHRPGGPARALCLLLSMPAPALLGVAIAGSRRVLYPSYARVVPPWGGSALSDQHTAGTLMWVAGMVVVPLALALVAVRWLDEEERQATRPAARTASPVPGG
jgi:cytochrome c oxidase assembly factor CtaG